MSEQNRIRGCHQAPAEGVGRCIATGTKVRSTAVGRPPRAAIRSLFVLPVRTIPWPWPRRFGRSHVEFTDPALGRKALSVVAQLAVWAHRVGRPVGAPRSFGRADRPIHHKGLHTSERWHEDELPRAALADRGCRGGPQALPTKPVSLRASDLLEPRSPNEITDLVSWSRGLPSESMRRDSSRRQRFVGTAGGVLSGPLSE